jgi:uncharacterized protein YecE (DUF72 family)
MEAHIAKLTGLGTFSHETSKIILTRDLMQGAARWGFRLRQWGSELPSEAEVLDVEDGTQAPRAAAHLKGIEIGTSGWHYAGWRGPFYPKAVKVRDQLTYYTTRFPTTEINNSFYRLPTEKAVKEWRAAVPEDFVFAWKASRYITHFRRLKDCEDSVELVFGRMNELGENFGPVLFQLPPQFHADRERLAGFLKLLPKKRRHAFEFRHDSWYAPEIFEVLADYNAALCISDHAAAPSPWEVTADFIYLRGHGPSGRYAGAYSDKALDAWAASIRSWRKGRREVYVYFDNDQKSQAPKDADRLMERLT